MLRDKRGFVLTLGIMIVATIAAIILIAGLLIFTSINKFLVIGTLLIVMTLIYGFKGKIDRNKSIIMVLFVGIGLLFVLGGDTLQTQFGAEPSYTYLDSNLGMVTFTEKSSGGAGVEEAYFLSGSGSSISVSNVGERVQICDRFVNTKGYTYNKFDWITYLNNNVYGTQSVVGWANTHDKWCMDFTPTKEGTYYVKSDYSLCPAINGWVCETLRTTNDRATKGGTTYYCPNYGATGLTIDGLKICENSKCALPTGTCVEDKSTDQKYYLEVKSAAQACGKSNYVGDWYVNEYITNGQVLRANVYYVNTKCEYYVKRYTEMTQCDDGFVIDGTNYHSTDGAGFNCVSIQGETTTEEDLNNNGVNDIYENTDSNCNTNLEVECGDGTIITSKICIDGLLVDTDQKCSTIGDSGIITGDVIGGSTPSTTTGETSYVGESESSVKKYIPYVVILLFIIIIGGASILMKKKKK